MRKGNLILLPLLLLGTLAVGEIHKWVDESGKVHYGDRPPAEITTQTVIIPKGPSEEDVELERQQMRDLIKEQHKNSSEEKIAFAPTAKPSQSAKLHAPILDDVACFSPISDLVQEHVDEAYTLNTATTLVKGQQALLNGLLAKIKGRATWYGAILELECWWRSSERTSSPVGKYKNTEVRMRADWEVSESRLTLNIEIIEGHNMLYRFEVGDFLYFNELKQTNITAREENKVEVLAVNQDKVSFFIKRYIPTTHRGRLGIKRHGTRLRGEIRQIEVSDKNLKLIELYYYDGVLASSRTWFFSRVSKN